jgi:TonB family protein
MNAIQPAKKEEAMLEMQNRTEMAERRETANPQAPLTSKQNVRLLIALSLLLVALVVVLVKDREFWFGSEQAAETQSASDTVAKTNSASVPAQTAKAPATAAAPVRNHKAAKPAAQPAQSQPPAAPTAPVTATNRVVLPPLDVEVVAGDKHSTVHPGSNVAKVQIPNDSNRTGTVTASMPASAAERERLSPVSMPELRQTVDATYPLLGQHMKVQGSVVLQAVIGADGTIENLRVLSGPAILAAAAQQAVRQWRFKPYLQNGQPVETKTRITVNFSIRVADNPSTTS